MKKYKSMFAYLMIAFLVPLICITITHFIPQTQSGTGYLILFGIAAISPTLAGLLTIVLSKYEESLAVFLKRCFFSKFNKKFCILAIIIPCIEITIMQALLYLGGHPLASLRHLNFMQAFIISYSLIAEEIGWRGFMQNRMDKLLKPFWVSVFTGIVWGLWHYHFYVFGSMTYPIHWFLAGCIADSCVYYWITRKANGNIIPASLLHFTYNLLSSLFFVSDTANPYIYPFFVTGSILVAAFMVVRNSILREKAN